MTPVSPQDLGKHWPFVEHGLKQIIVKTGEAWTPTHVKHAINEGWAWLYVADDGFVVLQVPKREWTADRYLSVWAMWFAPGAALAQQEKLFDWLDERAAMAGLGPWEFESPRMGWLVRARDRCEIVKYTWRQKT